MDPTRRDFLERTARASLVLGLPAYLFDETQEPASRPASQAASRPARPALLEAALLRMRLEKKPGVVLRMHPDAKRQGLIVDALTQALDRSSDPRTSELFAGTVIVCLETDSVDNLVDGARAEDEALLIDSNGRRIEGTKLLGRPLVDALLELVHGKSRERLVQRAKAARRELSADQLFELDAFLEGRTNLKTWKLGGDVISRWHEGAEVAESVELFESMLPILALSRVLSDSAEVRERIGDVVNLYLHAFEENDPGPVLPYGLELINPSAGSCGGRKHGKRKDPGAMVCGAANHNVMSHRFVGILAR